MVKLKICPKRQNDAISWITKTELMFDLQGTPEKANTKEGIICLTNQGFEWYKIRQNADPKFKDKSWKEFKKNFEIAYYPTPSETRYIDDIKILSFKQDRGECVVEYANRFQIISQNLPHKEHKRFTISRFIYGLHKRLQSYVMVHKPTDLDTAVKLTSTWAIASFSSSTYFGNTSSSACWANLTAVSKSVGMWIIT
jgi:hypothetical protein